LVDGATAIRLLKADPATRDIRLIALSAGSTLLSRIHELRADGVLGKPFDLDVLLADVALQVRLAGERSMV